MDSTAQEVAELLATLQGQMALGPKAQGLNVQQVSLSDPPMGESCVQQGLEPCEDDLSCLDEVTGG